VVANLPYSVAGRFLAIALSQRELAIARIVAVVQLELAERLAAPPGGRDYGSLSVLAQAFGTVERLRRIGRDVFRPRPRVDSALVRLTAGRLPPAGFAPLVRALFRERRKTLRHAILAVRPDAPPGVLARFGSRRAEQLDCAELLALHAELSRENA
jgi:16S rRNA (adenine1518-N6/adenine1519-N6)-dimethyltransferase